MHVHPLEKIRRLKQLRQKGYSINELVSELNIPKSTIWHHVHRLSIPPRYLSILESKRGGSKKRNEKNWEKAREAAAKLLSGPKRDSSIILAMLYWGEGSKRRCEFINSSGKMIGLYLSILRNALDVDDANIKPTLRIFTGMNEAECLGYWSGVTSIRKDKFLVRLNDGGTRGKSRYGMCRITVKKGGNVLKLIYSLINQIAAEIVDG